MAFPFQTYGPPRGPCPSHDRFHGPCQSERGHAGACESVPYGGECKHGFTWWPMGPRERPFTVSENAAYHGMWVSA